MRFGSAIVALAHFLVPAAALLVPAAALLVSVPALANDSKAESDKLFGEGLQLFAQKDFLHARVKFAEAYAKYPSPNSLLNLARSEQLSGECVDAVAHYRAYIALPENPRISTGDRGSAGIKLNECLARIGRIQVTAPRGAHVSVDGLAVVWNTGESIDVTPGAHRVDIAFENLTKSRTTSPGEGEVTSVQWEEPAPPVTPPPEVKPIPEVKIIEVPAAPVAVAPPPPPPKPIEWKTTTKWPTVKVATTVGLGIVAVGSFIAAPSFLAVSLSNAADANTLSTKLGASGCSGAAASSPDCVSLASKRSDQSTFGALSATFFVIGALSTAGAIVAMVLMKNIHPLVTASRDGLSFRF
jgi:hypothetical protein